MVTGQWTKMSAVDRTVSVKCQCIVKLF